MEVEKLTDEKLAEYLKLARIAPAKYVDIDDLHFARKVIEESAKRLLSISDIMKVAKEGLNAAGSLINSYCKNPALGEDAKRVDTVIRAVNVVNEYTKGVE